MIKILETIDSAINGPGAGRSTDVRQQVSDDGEIYSYSQNLLPDGWMISFPSHHFGGINNGNAPKELGGPVPVALVGHNSLSFQEFCDLVCECHEATYGEHRTAEQLGYVVGEQLPVVDLRYFISGGRYERPLKRICPETFRLFTMFVEFVDSLASFPMVTGILASYKESKNTFMLIEVYEYLINLSRETSNSTHGAKSLGNHIDHLNHVNSVSRI